MAIGVIKQNLMASADCEPTSGIVPGRPPAHSKQDGPSSSPRAGAVSFGQRRQPGAVDTYGLIQKGWPR
jgi:hypothetical protein